MKTKLPKIEWQAVIANADHPPYTAKDEHGNHWSMSANRELVMVRMADGNHFMDWTEQGCWGQYMEWKAKN